MANTTSIRQPNQDDLALIERAFRFDPETGVVSRDKGYGWWRPLQSAGTIVGEHRMSAHQIAWYLMTKSWPDKAIDHINGDHSDNRWCNLRLVSAAQNLANTKKRMNTLPPSSKYKGVRRGKGGKWLASIQIDGKYTGLGTFEREIDAAKAYDVAATKARGEYARCNFAGEHCLFPESNTEPVLKPEYKEPTIEERFWMRVNKDGPTQSHMDTPCWLWLGATSGQGYGKLHSSSAREGTQNWIASRYSYTLHNGEIPDGYSVCHRCDFPQCTNPEHLWIGTNQDNVDDRETKGRNKVKIGEEHWGAKLTDELVLAMRSEWAAGETGVALAKRYGVSETEVSGICSGKLWAHLPGASPQRYVRLTELEIAAAREDRKAGASYQTLAVKYDKSFGTMRNACLGLTNPDETGGVEEALPNPSFGGEACPASKLTNSQVIEIRTKNKAGANYSQLAKEYVMHKSSIRKVCLRITYKDVP